MGNAPNASTQRRHACNVEYVVLLMCTLLHTAELWGRTCGAGGAYWTRSNVLGAKARRKVHTSNIAGQKEIFQEGRLAVGLLVSGQVALAHLELGAEHDLRITLGTGRLLTQELLLASNPRSHLLICQGGNGLWLRCMARSDSGEPQNLLREGSTAGHDVPAASEGTGEEQGASIHHVGEVGDCPLSSPVCDYKNKFPLFIDVQLKS